MKPYTEPPMLDAFMRARYVAEGCQHRLGCKCDPPFWLREPSPIEAVRIEHMRRPFGASESQS